MNTMSSISAMTKKMAKPPSWNALGTGMDKTVITVYALDENNVYVGGNFTSAGNVSGTSYIAKWDGTNWNAMGLVAGTVYAIYALDASNVYVGGYFANASSVTGTSNIAKWDGTNWSALKTGVNSFVFAIYALDASNVYVGGNFNSASGVTGTSNIAKWDGASWTKIGGGVGSSVKAIYAYGNDIYVGGSFTSARNVSGANVAGTSYIAKWDGTNWNAMGLSVNAEVKTIYAVDASNVYVGGNFNSATNVTGVNVPGTNRIAKWDGTNWNAMGTGVSSSAVYAIYAVDANNVYVGGDFSNARNDSGVNVSGTRNIAKWDGTNWSSLGTSISNTVWTIYASNANNLYIGGDFNTNNVYRIGVWRN